MCSCSQRSAAECSCGCCFVRSLPHPLLFIPLFLHPSPSFLFPLDPRGFCPAVELRTMHSHMKRGRISTIGVGQRALRSLPGLPVQTVHWLSDNSVMMKRVVLVAYFEERKKKKNSIVLFRRKWQRIEVVSFVRDFFTPFPLFSTNATPFLFCLAWADAIPKQRKEGPFPSTRRKEENLQKRRIIKFVWDFLLFDETVRLSVALAPSAPSPVPLLPSPLTNTFLSKIWGFGSKLKVSLSGAYTMN